MKRVLLALGLMLGILSVPTQSSARKDVDQAVAYPRFDYQPLVFERYPLDLSDFDDPDSSADGPFNFTNPIGGYRPINYLFGDVRGGGLPQEMNHTFYGMDTSTPVFAGIKGTIFHIDRNVRRLGQEIIPECDWEIFISPDSPMAPNSLALYFDHVIPSQALVDQFVNGPVSVNPNTQIGTVGIRNDDNGVCDPATNAGWLEIGVIKNYPYEWWNTSNGQGMPTDSAAFCPVFFMPTSSAAPTMPSMPTLPQPMALNRIVDKLVRPDRSPPKIVSRTPSVSQRAVSKTLSSIKITFNEPVQIFKRGDLKVSVTRLTNQPEIKSVASDSAGMVLSRDKKTVTIKFNMMSMSPLTLENGSLYSVKIDGNIFQDLSPQRNSFAGISDFRTWTFMVGPTTVAPTPRTYTNIRSTIENQLRNIMVKYNRVALGTPGYSAYSDEQINRTMAMCSVDSFGGPIIR
jgi:Bacterial Ig-like domain